MTPVTDVAEPGPHEPYWLLRILADPRRRVRRHLSLRWRRRVAVLVGGMVGGAARLAISALLNDGTLPWGTLVANISGALLLGYLLARFLLVSTSTTLTIPLLCTGVLGSYTTFSTFSLEAWVLTADGRTGAAVGYAIASVALGLVAALAGIRLAEIRA